MAKDESEEDDWDEILEDDDLVEGVEGIESEEVEMVPPERIGVRAIVPASEVEGDLDEGWEEELESDAWSDSAATEINQSRGGGLSKRGRLPRDEEARVRYSAQDIVVNVGDFIEIDLDDGPSERVLRGKIIGMYGDRAVPEVDEIVSGTPQDPALKVEIYTKIGNEWMSTGKFVGMKMSQLQRSGELR